MKSNTVFIIAIIALIIIGVTGYLLTRTSSTTDYDAPPQAEPAPQPTEETEPEEADTPQPPPEEEPADTARGDETELGSSVEGRPLTASHFGDGATELLFVGGIHGGYSWNTALLAYELIDYLDANPDVVPENITVTVLPVANPDGLHAVAGTIGRFDPSALPSEESARVAARFNGNDVDLNRNFDCEWESEGTWQTRTVDGGDAPFSEPETQAIREYITSNDPAAVVVYYSAAGGVYSSSCNNGVSSETAALTNTYAEAASYPAFEEFDYYEITGDMVNWVAEQDIAGISVLLTDHESIEWDRNRAGVAAVLEYYAE